MENFLGDILSDLGGGTTGGIGLCASGNIGDGRRLLRAHSRRAPDIAGQDKANPISQILCAAQMLLRAHRTRPRRRSSCVTAVEQAFAKGDVVILPSGAPSEGTESVTQAVIDRL